ncbi:MAG TPA: hypothetical protein DDY91_04285 [Planctomycetaceae bacterium]|nr:hypothetical protein [Planctomycetaceae bacterium]
MGCGQSSQSDWRQLPDGDLILANEFEEDTTAWISVVNSLLLTTVLLAGMALLPGSTDSNVDELSEPGVDRPEDHSFTESADFGVQQHSRRDDVQERNRLRKQLQDAMTERDLLRQQQREAQAAQAPERLLASTTAENATLKAANRELENRLQELRHTTQLALTMMNERHEAILRPISKAPVVVRILSRQMRPDLDLDLYVQDPLDRLCHRKVPRIETRQAAVATLIPSELLVNVETDTDSQATQLSTEEIYYSTELLAGPASRPYLVFCMLRETGEHRTSEQIAQPVNWEVVINRKDQEPVRLTGQTIVSQTGRVMVQSTGDFYVGLVPLAGFHLQSVAQPEPIQVPTEELPEVLRGWRKGKLKEGATPLGKSSEAIPTPGR